MVSVHEEHASTNGKVNVYDEEEQKKEQEKKRNFAVVMSRQKPRTDAAGMWQCEMCSHHKRCKAVQSVHHLLHEAAAQITKAISVADSHI